MEAFRLSRNKYASVLSSSGAANRWNKDGEKVIYCGSSRSLSSLELVVHRKSTNLSDDYKVMVISLPDDDALMEIVKLASLPRDWRGEKQYPVLQELGSNWYTSKSSLILKVPSAIIPLEYNYVINCEHPEFAQVKLTRTEAYFWDSRLFDAKP